MSTRRAGVSPKEESTPPIWEFTFSATNDREMEVAASKAGFEPFAVSGNVIVWRKKG